MPTQTQVFAELAATFGGVDPSDLEAVQHWYDETLPTLPASTIEDVLNELVKREGFSNDDGYARAYPDKAPLPTLDQAPPVPLPLLAAGWREFLRRLLRRHEAGGPADRWKVKNEK